LKRVIISLAIAVFTLFTFDIASAQIEQGQSELSSQFSFMSRSYESSDNSFYSLLLAIRYGYFISKNLEFEPEMLFSIYKDDDPGFILSGNLAYNFSRSDPDNKIIPFIFGGFGISNTIIFLPNVAYSGAESTTWTLLNAGAGIKVFVSEQVALRWEYRYQRLFEARDVSYHNLYIGISVFLGD
jgi:hypothetical protein